MPKISLVEVGFFHAILEVENNSTYFLSIISVTADFSLSENVNDVTPQLILINNFLFDHKTKMSGFIIAFFDQKKLLNNHFIFN